MGAVYKRATPTSVIVAFGECRAEGESIDIALVKLAGALLDNEKCAPLVMDALKGRIKSDAA